MLFASNFRSKFLILFLSIFSYVKLYITVFNVIKFSVLCQILNVCVLNCLILPSSHEKSNPNYPKQKKHEQKTIYSLLQRLEYHTPLSFEQALSMGRTGRVLPSPVLNGYKKSTNGFPGRHSDSDEEDWC